MWGHRLGERSSYGPSARAEAYRAVLDAPDAPQHPMPPGWKQQAEEPRFVFTVSGRILRTPLDPRLLPEEWSMRLESNAEIRFVHNGQGVTKVDPRGLPVGWRMLLDNDGIAYFCSDLTGKTTYTDPRGLPDQTELRLLDDDQFETLDCYIDHQHKTSAWHDPRCAHSSWEPRRAEERGMLAAAPHSADVSCPRLTHLQGGCDAELHAAVATARPGRLLEARACARAGGGCRPAGRKGADVSFGGAAA